MELQIVYQILSNLSNNNLYHILSCRVATHSGNQGNSGNFKIILNVRETQGIFKLKKISGKLRDTQGNFNI